MSKKDRFSIFRTRNHDSYGVPFKQNECSFYFINTESPSQRSVTGLKHEVANKDMILFDNVPLVK